MGFGNKGFKKKGKLKTQIRLLGIVVVILGFLFSLYDLQNHDNQNVVISTVLVVIGMMMILQQKLVDGLKNLLSNIGKQRCNCCKCTNCSYYHNHWTHD